MGSKETRKVDLVVAQRMLNDGKSIREVAASQGVSTQSVYRLIDRGTLKRPEQGSPES